MEDLVEKIRTINLLDFGMYILQDNVKVNMIIIIV